MSVSFNRVLRTLEQFDSILGGEAVHVRLRQLPEAESLYFLLRQESMQELIRRLVLALRSTTIPYERLRTIAELALQMGKVQKSLIAARRPDAVRAVAREVSNLGFRLDEQLDLLVAVSPPSAEWGELESAPDSMSPGTAPAASGETPEPMIERLPRYANAALLDHTTSRLLDPRSPLRWDHVARLRLDIGQLSPQSQVTSARPFPDDRLPSDIDLDVMVSSTDFGVATSAKALAGRPSVAHGHFFLPGDGSPAVARDGGRDLGRYLTFYLQAPAEPLSPDGPDRSALGHCRIGYYYKNIIVQAQRLVAHFREPGGYSIETDFTLSEDLTHLEDAPTRPRISVLTNANAGGGHQIVLRHPATAPAAGDQAATIEIKEDNVGDTIRSLRRALALRAPTEKGRSRAQLAEDLRQFAPLGWSLYTQLPGKATSIFEDLFDDPEAFVVHVARPTTSSFVLPWDFIYEIPLQSGNTPTLCPLISQWDEQTPLFQGSPRQCPHGPHRQGDVLCPFGFWGFRYTIEQLSSTDRFVLTIPATPTSDFVMAETQLDVDLKMLATHATTLRAALAQALPQAQLREGKDRTTIQKLLGKDLPLVYFYCHGARANVTDPNVWLAIGKQETITAPDFIGWVVTWRRTLKKVIWDEVRPLVFINACHSLAIEPETLVSYLDAFIGRGRAAGVIGTEIKVSQKLAMDVAECFFASLLSGTSTVHSALRAIRMDYLRQGNPFGLIYTPYCWAELQITKT